MHALCAPVMCVCVHVDTCINSILELQTAYLIIIMVLTIYKLSIK